MIPELTVAIGNYFTHFAKPSSCANLFTTITDLINTDKPCGTEGDCYDIPIEINPVGESKKMKDEDSEFGEKNELWGKLH